MQIRSNLNQVQCTLDLYLALSAGVIRGLVWSLTLKFVSSQREPACMPQMRPIWSGLWHLAQAAFRVCAVAGTDDFLPLRTAPSFLLAGPSG